MLHYDVTGLAASILNIADWRLLVTVYYTNLHPFSRNASLNESLFPMRSFQVKLQQMRSLQ